jgi:hypothetical protein
VLGQRTPLREEKLLAANCGAVQIPVPNTTRYDTTLAYRGPNQTFPAT